jgi:SAM-dependent methyltransferase
MKKRLLDWLACPACGERLRLAPSRQERVATPEPIPAPACAAYCARHEAIPEAMAVPPDCTACYGEEVLEGRLECGCGAVYPVAAGIPRMSGRAPREDRRSARSFGYQWEVYREGDRTWFKDDRDLRRQEFLFNLQAAPEELAGRTLLDAGCGNGELTRAVTAYGLEVVGLDFSRSVELARERLLAAPSPAAHRVHYVQGDILELPIRSASFDLVHSSGVLHHTPSTHRAFRAVARAVKPGGKLYVQLYRRRPLWIHAVNVGLRAVTVRMPLRLLYWLCYLTTPLHAGLSRLMHLLRGEPSPPRATARERAVQMFDNYSPRYQFRHTVPEIMALFREQGFVHLQDVTLDNEERHMLAILGRKPAVEATEEGRPDASLEAMPGSLS